MDGAASSRRGFFGQLLKRGAEAAGDAVGRAVGASLPRRVRPPGAVDEAAFLARCTACGDCVEACPPRAIFTLHPDTEVGAGTPVMVPDERPCQLCEGFPCAAACSTGALELPALDQVRFGTAAVDPSRCFTFRGPECGACAGLCPSGIDALRMRMNRPVLNAEACIGCGLCIDACPTVPKAIVFAAPASAG